MRRATDRNRVTLNVWSVNHMRAGWRRRTGVVLLVLWVMCSVSPAAGAATAAVLPRVAPGLEYVHHRVGDEPWSIHVVKVRRSGGTFRLVSALAQDTIYGLAPVSGQIADLRVSEGRPVAAVNGDFFRIRTGPYQGDPLGLHIAQGELISSPTGVSFWIDGQGQPHIGEVMSRFRARSAGGLNLPFSLNQERTKDKAVLYTPTMGPSTRTRGGLELVLRRDGDSEWLPLRIGRTCRGRVVALNRQGDTKLEPDAVVLSVGPELLAELPEFATGMVISLALKTAPDLTDAVTAVGGGPVLLRDGKPAGWSSQPKRHPRTVLGWNDDDFFLVVVDGRQESLSVGMTYPELASLMQRYGCRHAMNLDGGGSSTLWLGGRIMNSPSDGRPRSVANSLIVISNQ